MKKLILAKSWNIAVLHVNNLKFQFRISIGKWFLFDQFYLIKENLVENLNFYKQNPKNAPEMFDLLKKIHVLGITVFSIVFP